MRRMYMVLVAFMCALFLLILFIGYALELYFKEDSKTSHQEIYAPAFKEWRSLAEQRKTALEVAPLGNGDTGSGDGSGPKKT